MFILHKTSSGLKYRLNMKPHNCKTCSEIKAKTQAKSRKAVLKANKPLG